MLMNKINDRGLPNGIKQQGKGYLAKYNHKELGVYPTVEQAYEVYIQKKKEDIIRIANEYRGIIPEEVYNAVISYEFSIKNDKNYVA